MASHQKIKAVLAPYKPSQNILRPVSNNNHPKNIPPKSPTKIDCHQSSKPNCLNKKYIGKPTMVVMNAAINQKISNPHQSPDTHDKKNTSINGLMINAVKTRFTRPP